MLLTKSRPAALNTHTNRTSRGETRSSSSGSQNPKSSCSGSSRQSNISGDEAAISSIRYLEKNVRGWKNQLKLLGRDFEDLVSKVERINTKYRAAVAKTVTTAKTQIALVRQVRHLYQDIAEFHGDSSNASRSSSILSISPTPNGSKKRLQERARDLKKDISGMYSLQHECALEFKRLGEEFTHVKDKVEDKIAHLKEKVQKLEDKEGKYKRIAQFAASAGLFAAAAAAIAGVFSFGTASLVVPLVISTVGPIVSFHATHKSQKLKESTNLPRRAIHILETVDECMTQKVDNCTTLSDRWTIIGNRVYELDALLSHSNTLGASQLATALLYEWEEVETCLQQYESLVDELKHTKHTGMLAEEPNFSENCESTSSKQSKSSAERWMLQSLLH